MYYHVIIVFCDIVLYEIDSKNPEVIFIQNFFNFHLPFYLPSASYGRYRIPLNIENFYETFLLMTLNFIFNSSISTLLFKTFSFSLYYYEKIGQDEMGM